MTQQNIAAHLGAVLDRLQRVRQCSGYHKALCPAHDDRDPSLSIWINDAEKVSLKCHARCDNEAILGAIGLTFKDLYPANAKANGHARHSKIVEVYDYTDLDGNVVHQTVRYEPRKFSQRRPGPGGKHVWKLGGIEPVLYHLPEVRAAIAEGRTVFVVEGEKDVDNAREQLGVTATTSPMGAGKWRESYTQALEGAHAVVVPDNDAAGYEHAHDVAARLVGVAASVKLVELPGLEGKGDLSDWLATGGTREQLREMVRGATPYSLDHKEKTAPNGTNHHNHHNRHNRSNHHNRHNRAPITAAELLAKDLGEVSWAVPGILPAGVALLAGKAKLGKSWMALGLCESIAVGAYAFGTTKVERGETLYLALEDNERRLKKRLRKVLDGRDAPEGMYIHTEWPRLDEGGAEQLDEWLTEHPAARLVVIDTLAKIRKPARGQNVYQEDYAALEKLIPIAARHGVAIIVVTHLRKAPGSDPLDEINASTGLTAGVDGFLILRRNRGGKGAELFVDGRDVEEPKEYAIHWNDTTGTWTIEGLAEEVRISGERAEIINAIRKNGAPMSPAEVAEATGKNRNTIKQRMWAMSNDGQLVKVDGGRYRLPDDVGDQGQDQADTEPTSAGYGGYSSHNRSHNRGTPDTYAENDQAVMPVMPVMPVNDESHNRASQDQGQDTNAYGDTSSDTSSFADINREYSSLDDQVIPSDTNLTLDISEPTPSRKDGVPVSFDLKPGETATVEELRERRGRTAEDDDWMEI